MSHYFTPVYPWQQHTWQKLTGSFPNCAHALLFSGAQGTGKLLFAQTFAAWVLCDNRHAGKPACGTCTSCQWLTSGTHPQLLNVQVAEGSKSNTIKVDDVRAILPFTQQSSSGARVVLIQEADLMNVSAANALLKTLEEPARQVYLLLTSNHPQNLLATIKSRVQRVDAAHVDEFEGLSFLSSQGLDATHAATLLAIAGGAPLLALELANQGWFAQRSTWLKVWQALRAGQRSYLAASQFWQKQLNLSEALVLNELMCRDMLAFLEALKTLQTDLDFNVLTPAPDAERILSLQTLGAQLKSQSRQNLSAAFAFDELMLNISLA